MITLCILLVVLALVLVVTGGVFAVLLDPLIAILAIYGIYRLIKAIFCRKKK